MAWRTRRDLFASGLSQRPWTERIKDGIMRILNGQPEGKEFSRREDECAEAAAPYATKNSVSHT